MIYTVLVVFYNMKLSFVCTSWVGNSSFPFVFVCKVCMCTAGILFFQEFVFESRHLVIVFIYLLFCFRLFIYEYI